MRILLLSLVIAGLIVVIAVLLYAPSQLPTEVALTVAIAVILSGFILFLATSPEFPAIRRHLPPVRKPSETYPGSVHNQLSGTSRTISPQRGNQQEFTELDRFRPTS